MVTREVTYCPDLCILILALLSPCPVDTPRIVLLSQFVSNISAVSGHLIKWPM